jgi:hypothetical protein
MHHQGYDLPERTGFGGLWSAMAEEITPAPTSTAIERHVIARSDGPRSPMVRAHLDAFRLALLRLDAGAENAAA